MASHAAEEAEPLQDMAGSDYGSDFSPEEVEIVERLLSPLHHGTEIEDNPIVNDIEYHDTETALRLPRFVGREQISPLLQAIRDAEKFAEQINASVAKREHYPDCELISFLIQSHYF